MASNMHPSLHVKQHFSQQPRKSLLKKHDACDCTCSMIVVRESVQYLKLFSLSLRKDIFPQYRFLILTSATFSVAKKCVQLVCIFMSKISHHKNTLNFACKKCKIFACKSVCKNLHASFLHGFFVEICHNARNLHACKCCNFIDPSRKYHNIP